jgi:hypothetical protein
MGPISPIHRSGAKDRTAVAHHVVVGGDTTRSVVGFVTVVDTFVVVVDVVADVPFPELRLGSVGLTEIGSRGFVRFMPCNVK